MSVYFFNPRYPRIPSSLTTGISEVELKISPTGIDQSVLTSAETIDISSSSDEDADISAVAATGTVTISDYTLIAGAVLSLSGVDFTEGVDFTAATDNDTTAESLRTAINGSSLADVVTVTRSTNVLTITCDVLGTYGNNIPLATSDATNMPVSGTALTGGVDATTGAKEVTIYGLDNTYAEVNETISLTGTTVATTSTSFFRVNSIEITDFGSAGTAVGDITFASSSSSVLVGKIYASKQDCYTPTYCVADGKTLYIYEIEHTRITDAENPSFTAQLFHSYLIAGTRTPFYPYYNYVLNVSGDSLTTYTMTWTFNTPIKINEKEDIGIYLEQYGVGSLDSGAANVIVKGILF